MLFNSEWVAHSFAPRFTDCGHFVGVRGMSHRHKEGYEVVELLLGEVVITSWVMRGFIVLWFQIFSVGLFVRLLRERGWRMWREGSSERREGAIERGGPGDRRVSEGGVERRMAGGEVEEEGREMEELIEKTRSMFCSSPRTPLKINRNVRKGVSKSLIAKVIATKSLLAGTRHTVFSRIWKDASSFKVVWIDRNFFCFEFSEGLDKKLALEGGPWSINGALILFRKWDSSIPVESVDFSYFPLWARLFNFPSSLRNLENVVSLADNFGGLLEHDLHKESSHLRKYVRLKVKWPVESPLIQHLSVLIEAEEGGVLKLDARYERLPDFCFFCGIIGHIEDKCKLKVKLEEAEEAGLEFQEIPELGTYGLWLKVENMEEEGRSLTASASRSQGVMLGGSATVSTGSSGGGRRNGAVGGSRNKAEHSGSRGPALRGEMEVSSSVGIMRRGPRSRTPVNPVDSREGLP